MKFSTALLLCGLASVLLALTLQFFHFRLQPKKTLCWLGKHIGLFLLSVLPIWSFLAALSMVFGHIAPALCIGGFLLLLMGYVNFLLLLYREKPFVPRDLIMALNLNQLAKMISPALAGLAGLTLAATAGLCILLTWVIPGFQGAFYQLLTIFLLGGILLLGFLTMRFTWNPMRKLAALLGADYQKYRLNVFGLYSHAGFLLTFLSQWGSPLMEKPDGYTMDTAKKLEQEYTAKAEAHNTRLSDRTEQFDILLIMSEAFSDPLHIPGLDFSEDPIPFIRSIMKDWPSGHMLAPGYGGGTAHCESEALTGFSTALCGDNSLYENCAALRDSFPSLVGALKSKGYRTVALHPYNDTMYARPKAYAALGFDRFIHDSGMKHRDKLEHNPYISDRAAYMEMTDLLLEDASPALIHLVTMQNHGDYKGHRYDNTIRVQGAPPSETPSLETYVQGLQYTDKATKALFTRLSRTGRKTLVLFWGDHLPMAYPQELLREKGSLRYQTPFFLWANFPLENRDYGTVSPFFFRHLIATQLNMPATPFDMLLADLWNQFHGIHMDFLIDAQGESLATFNQQQKELLERHYLAQYDQIAGEKFLPDSFFTYFPAID